MQQMRPSDGESRRPGSEGFFLPDFCAAPAVFFAVLLAELIVLLHVLVLGPLGAFSWQALATGSLFLQWNTLLSMALLCRLRPRLLHLGTLPATASCLAVVATVVALSSAIVYHNFPLLMAPGESSLSFLLRNVLVALVLAAIALRYAYLQRRVALQQRSELQLRLDALQARIRPHFLFNTLNSIASLIAIQPDRAEQAVEDVAELFRAALKDEGRDSTLDEEWHLCELYLELEGLRLGERLQVQWEMDDALRSQKIPALLLQPLVENAVYHGIAQRPEGGTVRIAAARDGARLCVVVENPLAEQPAGQVGSGQRMALDNIRQRLDARFGREGTLLAERQGERFVARLCLPLLAPEGAP
mgnify:FL=1